ncbi:ABC transporter permease [Cohnella sp. WQ 127256]|uniref:ABC transporter permease n=1 Tax=Cohnella sp. WQ 127256 TaxID=2938790 RepID=UPI0021180BB8|nr:ABC transporter permease [Cohnella sp. WQ 127256]
MATIRYKSKQLAMRALKQYIMPILAGVLFIWLWQQQIFHKLFNIRLHQLPLPSRIWDTFKDNIELLLSYTRYTMTEALIGMLIGSLIGFGVATIATAWPKWGSGGLLLIAALNAVPIIALAPIMNLWFSDGLGSRIAVVTVTTMAAMAFNAHKGLNSVDPNALDLMHSYGSSSFQVFRYLRLTNSLPYVFTALKINATASMIGAIVSEFFFSSGGLGYLLSNSIKVAKMSMGWACILMAAVAGVIFYMVIEKAEKWSVKWHSSQRNML